MENIDLQFILMSVSQKKSKTGKDFYIATVFGSSKHRHFALDIFINEEKFYLLKERIGQNVDDLIYLDFDNSTQLFKPYFV